MDHFHHIIEIIGAAVDGAGVLGVVLDALIAPAGFLSCRGSGPGGRYRVYVQDLGRAMRVQGGKHCGKEARPGPDLVAAAWPLVAGGRPMLTLSQVF